jgi:hypothetical protein
MQQRHKPSQETGNGTDDITLNNLGIPHIRMTRPEFNSTETVLP